MQDKLGTKVSHLQPICIKFRIFSAAYANVNDLWAWSYKYDNQTTVKIRLDSQCTLGSCRFTLTSPFNSQTYLECHNKTILINILNFFPSSASKCKYDPLYWSWASRIIGLHESHVWLKLYGEPGVEFHQELQLIHPKSCSVMQILYHLNSFILALGFAIQTNVIHPTHTFKKC